ncbi:MAG TPA: transglutaminaseTgpA domain-containing protein, partial [Pirellulales bacterium]|nr:transglutaminaseTgpA domain-containing protein [Pirellulales bacterium]
MRVERLLQVSIAVLVSLSTLLLGMGERNLTLPVIAVIVSASSLYLTDVKGWLQLNTTVTNLAGLAALGATWHDWDYLAGESQLLSMANLLIYLQFVLLYRKKDQRIYWLLILLSLLQVAVASALSMSIFFGLILLIYLFMGLLTLAIFSVYRELDLSQQSWLPWQRQELAKAGAFSEPQRRWPLAVQTPCFAGRPDEADADAGLTWGWVRQILTLGVMTVIFSSMLFFGLPRVGKGARWRAGHGKELRTIGFTESVTLGELGEAYQNDNALMQAFFYEGESNEPYRIAGDAPMFRGALLTTYQNGQWHRGFSAHSFHGELERTRRADVPPDAQIVRQRIKLQPRSDDTLFAVFPVYQLHEVDPDLRYSRQHEQLYRSSRKRTREFEYELYTTGFRDHLYSMITPAPRLPRYEEFTRELLQMPEEVSESTSLAGLKALAGQLVDEVPSIDRERRARILEMYLRDVTKFRYSLKPVERDPNLDPIEDFLTRHPTGHCEYFASALTLMLRSVGIPSRMVIGFKGGEWNDVGKYYQVRELHAHAWVEAYMGADNLPAPVKNSPLAQKY